MNDQYPKRHRRIGATILLVLSGFIFVVMISACRFLYDKILSADQQISMVNSDIESKTEQVSEQKALESKSDELGPKMIGLNSTILASDAVVPFVESIEKLSKNVGVTMTDSLSKASDPRSTIGTEFLVVNINLSGTWNKVTQMISLIENIPYASVFDSVTLDKDYTASNTNRSIWGASLILRVMKYKSDQ